MNTTRIRLLPLCMVFGVGAVGQGCSGSDATQPNPGQCQTSMTNIYDRCQQSIGVPNGGMTEDDATTACNGGELFAVCASQAALCAVNDCATLALSIPARCGSAAFDACVSNVQYFMSTCQGQFMSSSGAWTQDAVVAKCGDFDGLPNCFNNCVYLGDGQTKRACNDVIACFLDCFDPEAGQPTGGALAVPDPCPSNACAQICDVASSTSGCNDTAVSTSMCQQGCKVAEAHYPACVSCMQTAVSGNDTCSIKVGNAANCATGAGCAGANLSWFPTPK